MARKIISQKTDSGQDSKSIFRTPKRKNFIAISNALAQNPHLDLDAKGLMLLVLSLPEDWEMHFRWMQQQARCGRQKLQGILRQLMEHGYLERDTTRKQGRFSTEYRFYETPFTGVEKPNRSSRVGSTEPVNQSSYKEHSLENEVASTKPTKEKKKRGSSAATTDKSAADGGGTPSPSFVPDTPAVNPLAGAITQFLADHCAGELKANSPMVKRTAKCLASRATNVKEFQALYQGEIDYIAHSKPPLKDVREMFGLGA